MVRSGKLWSLDLSSEHNQLLAYGATGPMFMAGALTYSGYLQPRILLKSYTRMGPFPRK